MNLKAKAISIKPSTTFTLLSQPPDFGKVFNRPGKNAKTVNGIANDKEKPNMPMMGLINAPPADDTRMLPTIGPVHENETSTKVNAIKKTPNSPPFSACWSTEFTNEPGN